MSYSVRIDEIIVDLGGCGAYQWILASLVHTMKLTESWSMLTMTFAGQDPGYWCNTGIDGYNVTTGSNVTDSLKDACSHVNSSTCSSFTFNGNMETIVSEYGLICGRKWIVPLITTLQMAGVLIGCFLSGHLGDAIGRKPTFFLAILMLVLFNFAAIFAPTWPVYAAARVAIGVGVGFFITVQYLLMMELMLSEWRPRVVAVPSWPVHAALLALLVWLLHDWKYIHIFIAAVGLPFLATWFFIPESVRWLIIKQRYQNAENVISFVAKLNRRKVPDISGVFTMATEEHKREHEKKNYTVIDVFRYNMTATLGLMFIWMSISFSYYSIAFGIQNLSGNLYLNMFLSSVIEIPAQLVMMFFANRIGRRNTSIIFFFISGICGLVVGAVHYLNTPINGQLTNVFAYTSKFAMTIAWGAMTVLTTEIYPTVVRTMAYGLHNTSARVGGMIAPQIVFLNDSYPGLMFFLIGGLMTASSLIFCLFTDTKDKALEDTYTSHSEVTGKEKDRSSTKM